MKPNRTSIWLNCIFLILPILVNAQESIDSVLLQVKRNNTTLEALRKNLEAEKIGNKTGIYLENPEINFNYLWVDPSSIGNRTDISIRQSFDFPSAYGHRKQISDIRNSLADLEYQEELNKVMLQARLLCIEIVNLNARILEVLLRKEHAEVLAVAYQKMYDSGQTGILEYNKVRLNLLTTGKDLESLRIERASYLEQLRAMNGGSPIELSITKLPEVLIPPDFDQWYTTIELRNPTVQRLEKEAESSLEQEKLNLALSLPKATAGYMSENRTGEHFQGVTAGISIPLWENRNTVKYMQVKTLAWHSFASDYKLQLYNMLSAHYDKTVSLKKSLEEYNQLMDLYSNNELLKKALDLGEISLLNYLMELSLSYSTMDKYLDAVNEFNVSAAHLFQYGN